VEASSLVKDTRIAEIIWMTVIAIVVAAGGNIVLGTLALHRGFATVLLAAVVVAALLAVRRAMAANAPSARIDVTKAATYLVAAVFAFVAIGLHVHWAIGATIAAAEAAIVFDIVTIAARPKAAPGKELP
jgi:predicted permease